MNKVMKRLFNLKGNIRKRKYFEGWYFKMVTKDKAYTLSFIPGISLNKEHKHAFIQVILKDSIQNRLTTEYLSFDIGEFNFDKKCSFLTIQSNTFGLEGIKISYQSKDFQIKGSVRHFDFTPIKTNIFSPTIMGIFQYIPLMECYHSVISMNHKLKGKITFLDKEIDFTNGLGYIEKDYGRSFPEKYVWLQSNHFKDKTISLMLSVATIPYLFFKFKGLIANVTYCGKEYRFATYNRTRICCFETKEKSFDMIIKKGKYKLKIKAKNELVKELASPKDGEMANFIKEGLSGKVVVTLYKNDFLIFKDVGKSAGLEIMY